VTVMPPWHACDRAVGSPMTLRKSAKYLNKEARKDESISQPVSCWYKLAENI